jgi:hypothetical protein
MVAMILGFSVGAATAQTLSERRFLVSFSAVHYVTTECPDHDACEVDLKGVIRQVD